MPLELMASSVETSAVQEGLHGPTSARIYTTEGLLPRPAAIATHPLLRRRHQQPSCIGLALRVLAHAVAASTSFSSPTRSSPTPRFGAHSPLDVHPLAPARVRFRPPAFVGFGFSAVAPRPDPIGQFLPHQEHHPTDCFTDLYDLLRLFSSTITPPTRQDALWLSPHHILTFFFLTDYATH